MLRRSFLTTSTAPTHSQLALRRLPQHVQHSATPTRLPRRGGSCLLVRARPWCRRRGLPPSFVAGRAKLQPPRPVGIVRPCWQAPILLPNRSCTPSLGLSLAVSSLQSQSHQFCPIPAISSVFSSCAACASPCLLLSAPAGAVAFWTFGDHRASWGQGHLQHTPCGLEPSS